MPQPQTHDDPAAYVGGPGDAADPNAGGAPAGGADTAGGAPAGGAGAPQDFFIVGGKRMTATELAEYTAGIELQNQQMRAAAGVNGVGSPPAPTEENPADYMFTDPERYTKTIKEMAKREVKTEIDGENARKSIWQDFYSAYADLKGNEDLVELCRNQNWEKLKNLPLAEATTKLATLARERISKIRGVSAGDGVALPNGAAVTGGSSSTKGAPPAQAKKPSTFMEEMKAMQKRKK